MKRYDLNRYGTEYRKGVPVRASVMEESPKGEWVRWEECEVKHQGNWCTPEARCQNCLAMIKRLEELEKELKKKNGKIRRLTAEAYPASQFFDVRKR